MAASQPPHTDVISVKSVVGRCVAMVASGAGLLAVTDLALGTDAPTGVNATSSSLVARTATIPKSADAVARVSEKGKQWARGMVSA